jgi:hypothetical protein
MLGTEIEGKGSPGERTEEVGSPLRITFYITREKEFALKYLALKRRKSVNKVLNELVDRYLNEEHVDPAKLLTSLP